MMFQRRPHVIAAPVFLLLAILSLVACDDDDDDDSGGNTASALDCEAQAYPCALAEVTAAALTRGEDLTDQALAMIEGGASLAEALDWLMTQDGVVDGQTSRTALRFRLDGGRDIWILSADALSPNVTAQAVAAAGTDNGEDAQTTARGRVSTQAVVGEDPEAKHALVLAPFKYQFGDQDDGAPVAQLLRTVRGYDGRVTYLENPTKGSTNVGIQQFFGWEDYDVIHVASHGAAICDQTRCSGIIETGDIYSSAQDLLQITEAGVNTVHIAGDDARHLGLSADFFRHQYPGGLTRAIIFFNACQTFGGGDFPDTSLGDSLIGENSVYLGWTNTVRSDHARSAALAFYQKMSDTGISAQRSADDLGDLAFSRFKTDQGVDVESILLVNRDVNQDARLREVPTLENPDSGSELAENDVVAAVGTANDGAPDSVPYQVLVEGIQEDQQDVAMVQVSVDGHASTPSPVSAGERVGDTGWRLSGAFPYIDLDTSQFVAMQVRVDLPEGGTSQQTLVINLTAEEEENPPPDGNPPPDDGGNTTQEVWVGTATGVLNGILTPLVRTVVAEVTYVQTATSVGEPTKRLSVSGGKMFWSQTGSVLTNDGQCAYSAGPIEVPIHEGDGEIRIDTTTNSYTMHGFTPGFPVEVAQNCGDYAFTTSTDGVWSPTITEFGEFSVSADGGSIGGNTSGSNRTWEWSFQRQ